MEANYEIKVAYITKDGSLSKAYVSEEPPHIGTDKYTDESVEIELDGGEWHERHDPDPR